MVGIQGITRFGLAHAIPIGGKATCAQIAEKAGIGDTHIRRLLRLAISQHIFQEARPGVVTHTAASRLPAEYELLHQWMAFKTDEGWAGANHACGAMAKWPDSGEPDETGFALGHEGKGTWGFLSAYPERESGVLRTRCGSFLAFLAWSLTTSSADTLGVTFLWARPLLMWVVPTLPSRVPSRPTSLP